MKIIVYAESTTKASRGYRARPGEVVAYRDIKDHCDTENERYDLIKYIGIAKPKKIKKAKK